MAIDVMGTGRRIGETMLDSVADNAVITKEFRTRMRGWKPYVVMGGYVLLLLIVMVIAFWTVAETAFRTGQYSPISNSKVGLSLFGAVAVAQVILLTLILPSLTASSVTQELERRTIDMLALTKLTPGRIVMGKHLSGFLYALVLLVCSVPLAGLCMMFGGISPGEVAATYVAIAAWAFMFTAVGTVFSSLVKKTAAATLASYGFCVGYMLLSQAFTGEILMSGAYGGSSDYSAFSGFNPAFAPWMALEHAKVSGVQIPVVLISSVVQVALGVLMLLVASTHVKYQRAERALPIRLLLMLVSGVMLWLLPSEGWNSSYIEENMAGMSIFTLVMISLFSILFATGQIQARRKSLVIGYALSPRRIFRSDVGGGILFNALWTVFCHAILGLSFFWTATAEHVMLKASYWSMYWRIGVVMVAVVIGVSALGVLFSAMSSKRRNAIAFAIVAVVVLFTGYMFMMLGFDYSNRTSPVWQAGALWPITPILVLMGEWDSGVSGAGAPALKYERYTWVVTSAIYVLMAAGALGLAGRFHSRGMGVQEEE